MRVLIKDENGNPSLIDANTISRSGSSDLQAVAITAVGGSTPLLCEDEELFEKFDTFIVENADKIVIDLSKYMFKTLSIEDIFGSF